MKAFNCFLFLNLFLVAPISSFAGEQLEAPSAVRPEGKSFEDMLEYHLSRNQTVWRSNTRAIVQSVAVAYDQLDLNKLPEWKDGKKVEVAFNFMRDSRLIEWKIGNIPFPRRITWMYPDDGCYLRAANAAQLLESWGYLDGIKKVFAFGNLTVNTSNSLWGKATWWYHVALGFRFNGVAMIFDPALDPSAPLTLEKWVGLMQDSSVKLSICDANAFEPFSSCEGSPVQPKPTGSLPYKGFLDREWARIEKLGRSPEQELGALPPWLH